MVDPTRQAGWKLALAMVISFASAGACFSPDTQEGLACSPTGACPFEQVCIELVCRQSGAERAPPDAAMNVVNIDAAISGDADTSCASNTVQCGEECLSECPIEFATPGEISFQPGAGCTYLRVQAWGAGGGHGTANLLGAAGGYASIERAVSSDEVYTIFVGAPGTNAVGASGGAGGLPGGGNGGSGNIGGGGGGGGYSGLFFGGTAAANSLLIAGGGGGSGSGNGFPANTNAGAGGGMNGQVGSIEGDSAGGTQNSGNAPLVGGVGGNGGNDSGGGGGGGWYGGKPGDGVNSDDAQGAGGGSGYVGAAVVFEWESGNRSTPGNEASLLRGTAGSPTNPGKILTICYPAPPPI